MLKLCLASASPQRLALLRQIGLEPELYPVETAEELPDHTAFLESCGCAQYGPEAELRYIVQRIAAEKLRAALRCHRDGRPAAGELWLAADTLVAVPLRDGRASGELEKLLCAGARAWGHWLLLGKAGSVEDAKTFLRLLSGVVQSVCSAVAFRISDHPVLEGSADQACDSPGIWAIPVEASVDDGGECLVYGEISTLQFRNLSEVELEEYVACDEWRGAAGGYRFQGLGGKLVAWGKGSQSNIIGLPLEFCKQLQGLIG
ncbi:Maf family protein [Candidatus Haliotispira prima]|uniref:Nucleoside triphosphate pyrophosphatase n=1 Tax=Candidatus Haliotispira prima TaxID=3034016 RepID=A0ABY8MFF6_9SPIO|nr:Maf family protein [Candidatus Haliotispira prima]